MQPPSDQKSYPKVPSQPSYPDRELETLAYWEENGTFQASIDQRKDAPQYVFNDGPPFANGLPHYGHLLTGYVKDAIPRYKTMRGMRVERRFGWDCHGLPAETEAEKELGVSGRGPITDYGIDKFNDYCRTAVLRYVSEWQHYVTRQARWVDFSNDYKTMDLDFMESVIWAFKELHDRGLIYEAYRVLPYCWECETPLSNSETRLDDAYRDRVDPAVTVAFSLAPLNEGGEKLSDGELSVLVWTTTPWTLPSNLALAVGPDVTYVVVQKDGKNYLIGKDRVAHYAKELAIFEEGEDDTVIVKGPFVVEEVSGADLVGRTYTPLFPYFADHENAFTVIGGDFVTTDEGTGIVHMAPGFGEDDQRVCEEAGIAVVCPVDDRGRFDERVPDFFDTQVFDANEPIITALTHKGVLLRREEYEHSYPHCWRTDTPLIYKAASSFFVAVNAVKERLLATNEEVDWFPSHVKEGAFGKWLANARDWSITRNRFWGTPIPVWRSDNPEFPRIDVYGSLDDIAADFGVRPTDLHRPGIDELTRPNPDDPSGQSTMRRVTDVLDCWFESGAMPFAELHAPFENADLIPAHVPADFICEYMGQTRAWFYYQHVLAGALFDRGAFKNVIAHGIVLGDDGRKLSKRLKNYPDPEEFFRASGADTMRWYLLASPVLRGQDVVIEEQAMREPIRQVLNPLWNTWYFLSLYGATDGIVGTIRGNATGVLDRYILAKTQQLGEEVTSLLERYDLAGACASVTKFLDALTNWYVRRSRDRFWRSFDDDEALNADKTDAYDTLHTVLETVCRLVAPMLPLLSEDIYRGLTGADSVHLRDWPQPDELPRDTDLVEAMDLVREVCSAAHSIRKAEGLRARLPLTSLTFAGPNSDRLAPYRELIADEVNVKTIIFATDIGDLATEHLAVIPAAIGPRLGPNTQKVIVAVKKGDWKQNDDGSVVAGGVDLLEGEYTLTLRPTDEHSTRVLTGESGVVVIDTVVTPELFAEGTARDCVRLVQQARKDADFDISDRITLELVVSNELAEMLKPFHEDIASQTLAISIAVTVGDDAVLASDAAQELPGGERVIVKVKQVTA